MKKVLQQIFLCLVLPTLGPSALAIGFPVITPEEEIRIVLKSAKAVRDQRLDPCTEATQFERDNALLDFNRILSWPDTGLTLPERLTITTAIHILNACEN